MSAAAAREKFVRIGLSGPTGRQLAEGIVLVALTVLILWLRRPDQFSHPYIWGEEGWILKHYAAGGAWRALVEDINGFPDLISKLLALIAFKTAIFAAPEVGVALVTAFTCVVVLCIRFAPTHLPARFACALMPLVIPSGPECFAVMLYAFWWAGLLPILALLWRAECGGRGWRAAFMILGGLSSPIVVALSPLFVLRALIGRDRFEWSVAALAVGGAAVHVISWIGYAAKTPPPVPNLAHLPQAIGRYVGGFANPNLTSDERGMVWGIAVLTVIAVLAFVGRRKLDRHFVLLALAWALICASTLLRVPAEVIHPFLGPRYVFYPYTLIGFALIWVAAAAPLWLRALPALILVAAVFQGLKNPQSRWRHDRIDFSAELLACARQEDYAFPVHVTGGKASPLGDFLWRIPFRGAECRALVAQSLIR